LKRGPRCSTQPQYTSARGGKKEGERKESGGELPVSPHLLRQAATACTKEEGRKKERVCRQPTIALAVDGGLQSAREEKGKKKTETLSLQLTAFVIPERKRKKKKKGE